MTKQKRRKYTKEFKEEAVKLITEQGYMISEAARNLEIHKNFLGKWKRESLESSSYSSAGDSPTALKAELARLRKENKQLKMEREILKKAKAFFVKEKS
ncbi:MAG: transposase [Desulfobacula sp.]|nr:transposase [Desulfobacula sp.]